MTLRHRITPDLPLSMRRMSHSKALDRYIFLFSGADVQGFLLTLRAKSLPHVGQGQFFLPPLFDDNLKLWK